MYAPILLLEVFLFLHGILIALGQQQLFKPNANTLYFHEVQPFMVLSSFEIVAIQRDSYEKGLVLIADRHAIRNINLTSRGHKLLIGTDTVVADSRDGGSDLATFSQIVDIIQPNADHIYVAERFCIRRVKRELPLVETLSADCSSGGNSAGLLPASRFSRIVSIVLVGESQLVVAESSPNSHILSVDLDTLSISVIIDNIPGVTTLIADILSSRTLYVFLPGAVKRLSVTNGATDTLLEYSRRDSVDGMLHDAQLNYISGGFAVSKLIVTVDLNHNVLRIINHLRNVVTSICQKSQPVLLGTRDVESRNFSSCRLPSLVTASYFPEMGFVLLGGYSYLAKLAISVKFSACKRDEDCKSVCDPGKTRVCRSLGEQYCDPRLGHCTLRCNKDGVVCPHGQQCVPIRGESFQLCRKHCVTNGDCLFNNRCYRGYCTKPINTVILEEPPIQICLSSCQCIYIRSFTHVTPNHAKIICANVRASLFTVSTSEDGVNPLSWVKALLQDILVSRFWVQFDESVMKENLTDGEIFEGRELKVLNPLYEVYYNLNNLSWGVALGDYGTAAVSLCHSVSTPVNINHLQPELSPISTCGDNSRCREKLYPGCRVDLVCEEVESEHCCYMNHLLEYDVIVEDLEDLSQLNFSEPQVVNCSLGTGIGKMEVRCASGSWVTSQCHKETASSAENESYVSGDLLLVGCDQDHNGSRSQSVPNRIMCTERGWQPPLHTLKTEKCLEEVTESPKVGWFRHKPSRTCYGLLRTKVTYRNAIDYCSKLSASLARVTNSSINSFIRGVIKNFTSRKSGFWISGLYDMDDGFRHVDGSQLGYLNFPEDGAVSPDECLQISYKSEWMVKPCGLSSVESGAICQRWKMRVHGNAWSSWGSWSACLVTNGRVRQRRCRYGSKYCSVCDGDGKQFQPCCTQPDEYVVGTKLKYKCVAGYINADGSEGSTRITCLANGTWSRSPPKCVVKQCRLEDLAILPNSNSYILQRSSAGTYHTGFSVYRVCNHTGHVLRGLNTSKVEIKCSSASGWGEDKVQMCKEVSCGEVPLVANAEWNKTITLSAAGKTSNSLVYYLDQVVYMCLSDYHHMQSRYLTLTCQSDGTYDDKDIGCIEKSCDRLTPDLPRHSYIDHPLPVRKGERVNLTCEESYAVDGVLGQTSQLVECVEVNRWQLLDYKPCLVVFCPHPGNTTRATFDSDPGIQAIGGKILYLCEDGTIDYTTGSAVVEIECLANFTWSAPAPHCTEILCKDPGQAQFASRHVSGYRFRDRITYKCWIGHVLAGTINSTSNNLTCQENAQWDKPVVDCIVTAPYHSLKLEHVEGKTVKMSLIQKQEYKNTPVNYRLVAKGFLHEDLSGMNFSLKRDWLILSTGISYLSVDLLTGFFYNLTFISGIGTDNKDEYSVQLISNLLYIPGDEPQVYPGLSLAHSQPIFRSEKDVMLALPFDLTNGQIKAFSVVFCDMISYLPKEHYDGKLIAKLPTYSAVTAAEEDRPIWGCYQTMAPCPVDDYSNCKDVTGLEKGYIRYYEIQRLRYRVGAENCDSRDTYCNGKLKAMSTFCVKLRTYSADDYADSPCSVPLQTDAEFNMDILSSFFVPVTLVTLMVVLGEVCRNRYHVLAEEELGPADQFVELNENQRINILSMSTYDAKLSTAALQDNYVVERSDLGLLSGDNTLTLPKYRVIKIGLRASHSNRSGITSGSQRRENRDSLSSINHSASRTGFIV